MVVALEIRTDLSAGELRALARREKDPRAASRMYAIAHALEGRSRAEAARLSGMERQALHDAVVRYNGEGLAGLHNRPKGHRGCERCGPCRPAPPPRPAERRREPSSGSPASRSRAQPPRRSGRCTAPSSGRARHGCPPRRSRPWQPGGGPPCHPRRAVGRRPRRAARPRAGWTPVRSPPRLRGTAGPWPR